MSIKIELVNPFVTAAAEVLRKETNIEIRRGQLSLQSSAIITDDVATVISLIGAIEGMVLFNMSREMCLHLVSSMMGQEFDDFDELAQSGIAELGNVIAGRAATKLSNAGMEADISVPTMIIGRGTSVSAPRFQRLVVPLETDYGIMEIHLALRQK